MRILILCLQLSAVGCWVQDLPAKSFGILPSAAHKFLAVSCTLLFAPEGFFLRTGERWSKQWIQLIFGYVLVGCQRKLWLQGFGQYSFWRIWKGDGNNNATKALGLIFSRGWLGPFRTSSRGGLELFQGNTSMVGGSICLVYRDDGYWVNDAGEAFSWCIDNPTGQKRTCWFDMVSMPTVGSAEPQHTFSQGRT